VQGQYAVVAGLQGDAAIYSIAAGKTERSLPVGEPVTDAIWTGTRLIFGTSKGSVKVFDSGSEVASLSEHAGAITALSLHPSGVLLASVGSDKAITIYDLSSNQRVSRSYSDSRKCTSLLVGCWADLHRRSMLTITP
jgi:pre-mRNA-processing factor 19